MSSLVLELQRDAMESRTPITDLMRKALVLAKKLGVIDFQKWICAELEGYKPGEAIPRYRIVKGEIRAWNPYNGWIPYIIEDPREAELLMKRSIGQPLAEIDSLLKKKDKEVLVVPFSPEIESELLKNMEVPLRPMLHVSENRLHGIIDAVRNAVLNWTLKLEEKGILGEGMTFTEEEKNKAKGSTQITIHNFRGILGDIQQSNVNQNFDIHINKNDFAGLSKYLTSIKVLQEDLDSLKSALDSDPSATKPGNFGDAVSKWIGKMISKAASGAWQISISVAGELLTKALIAYYGIQ